MKNLLKQNNGAVLALAIIVSTCGVILLTTLLNASFHNYKITKAVNNRSNAYYIADFGMEKTIKNIESIIESAKIYADEKVRSDKCYEGGSLTPYEYLAKYGSSVVDDFKQKYEEYYKDYLLTNDHLFEANTSGFVELGNEYTDLPEAQYQATITDMNENESFSSFNNDYKIMLTVTGNNNGEYERTVEVEMGIYPWGYNSSGDTIDPDLKIDKYIAYSSPQWSGALSSSGDIVVKGDVTVKGDIYVNGKSPEQEEGEEQVGREYGGLIVGKDYVQGDLTVHGNIFSTNYVHTMTSNSSIKIKPREGKEANYDTEDSSIINVDDIYNHDDITDTDVNEGLYSEKAENLNKDNDDPLNLDHDVWSSFGRKLCNVEYNEINDYSKGYIPYLMSTYKIQKEYGGFVYADSVQVEKDAFNSNITTDGSVIAFDNLRIDDKGQIKVNNNFYGFIEGTGDLNTSSSIITNHSQGDIYFNNRIYNAGLAYVTAYNSADKPYRTGETISICKNFYSYRNPLPGEPTETETYSPFKFLTFGDVNSFVDKIQHVFKYDQAYNSDDTFTESGLAYDKFLVHLDGEIESGPIYDMDNYDNVDMGFAAGILMGKNSNGDDFIGNVKNETSPILDVPKAKESLTRDAFLYYICHKYAALMQTKALKCKNGEVITISDLLDKSVVDSDGISSDANDLHIVVSEGDIEVSSSGNTIYITHDGETESVSSLSNTFKGVIVSTDGKITIKSGVDIEGAVISGKNVPQPTIDTSVDTVGIEILGNSNITYDKDVLMQIFKLPATIDAGAKVKQLLTSKRGIIEMFTRAYNNNWWSPDFKSAVDNFDYENSKYVKEINPQWEEGTPDWQKSIEAIAYEYEINNPNNKNLNDVNIVSSNIDYTYEGEINDNYKIFTWKSVQ